jgi:hypothetical protein
MGAGSNSEYSVLSPANFLDTFPRGLNGLNEQSSLGHVPSLEGIIGCSVEHGAFIIKGNGSHRYSNHVSATDKMVVIGSFALVILGSFVRGRRCEHHVIGVEKHLDDWGGMICVRVNEFLWVS